ncbi:MAG: hypothetical protein WBO44_06070 [Saprospiraceae bacterium]
MDQIPYRIRIGVTGHRKNLPDSEVLMSKIKQLLGFSKSGEIITLTNSSLIKFYSNRVRKTCEANAKDIPLVYTILSSLAEGADRIVADAVLDLPNSKLDVILPLDVNDYTQDFQTEDSKTEFHNLLNKADFIYSLKSSPLSKNVPTTDLQEARNEAYLKAGQYIVAHCDVLIAVWDGKAAKGKGGTAEIVDYAREQQCPIIIISSLDPQQIAFDFNKELPFEPVQKLISLTSAHTNVDSIKSAIKNNFGEFYREENQETQFVGTARIEKLKNYLLPLFALADLQAMRSKRIFENTGLIVYALSFLAVTTILIAVIFHLNHLVAFIIEFILLLSILLIIKTANQKGFHKNWLANRFLVEKLRSTVYLFVAGVPLEKLSLRQVNKKQREHYGWAIDAYNEIKDQLNQINSFEKNNKSVNDINNYIKSTWIDGQLNFQKKYAAKNTNWNLNLEKGGVWLFRAALFLAGAHIISCYVRNNGFQFTQFEEIMTLITLLLLPLAAAFDGIRNQREFSRNASRSESMIQILTDLKEKYEAVDTTEEFYKLLRETDTIMLQENQDWMLLMQSSELEVKP